MIGEVMRSTDLFGLRATTFIACYLVMTHAIPFLQSLIQSPAAGKVTLTIQVQTALVLRIQLLLAYHVGKTDI